MKKLLLVFIAVLSFLALLNCLLFIRDFTAQGSVSGINPQTGDYLNLAIYASFGVLALLVVFLAVTAKSKR